MKSKSRESQRHVVILAGPNGAGKSTAAPRILNGALAVRHFVNADVIARGLSGFTPDEAAPLAGRIMLDRLFALAAARETFAFETTLASRTFVPWIRERIEEGYRVHLAFVSVPSADVSVARVRERVSRGGHDVPEATVRQRFVPGLSNLFRLYLPIVSAWQVFDNSRGEVPRLVARGELGASPIIRLPIVWNRLREIADGPQEPS